MLHFKDQPGWTYVFGPSYPTNLRKVHPFSRQSIHKQTKKKRSEIIWSKVYSGLEKLMHEYCSISSIHGMSHIGSRRSMIERGWWLTVCVLSAYGCGMLIQKTYQKWDDHPVIVSFDERPVPVWKIPFPAVTICPEAKINTEMFNFTEELYRFAHTDEVLTEERLDQLMTVLQICDEFWHTFERYYVLYSNKSINFVSIFKELAVTKNETIVSCWRDMDRCGDNITETITEDGICFTFNGFSSQDMFKNGTMHTDFKPLGQERIAINWAMEGGYKEGSKMTSYPQRAAGTGSRLTIQLKAFKQHIEAHCTEEQGFRVTLHAPDEYPMVSKKFIILSTGRDINIAINPQILYTAEELRNYDSERRQCLFNGERQLRFFRVYNQNNCELECMTNHTLEMCGCVKFSMPHSQETRVCSTRELNCVRTAELDLLRITTLSQLNDSQNDASICDCMPSCSSIEYQTEVTQSLYNFEETLELRYSPFFENVSTRVRKTKISKISIYFKQSQFIASRRSELYGMTDFVANCGGILGLCLGISLFGLVELVYYCTVRPFQLIRKNIRRRPKVTEIKEAFVSRLCY